MSLSIPEIVRRNEFNSIQTKRADEGVGCGPGGPPHHAANCAPHMVVHQPCRIHDDQKVARLVSGWSVDPEDQRFGFPRIAPAVLRCAGEIETVAGAQPEFLASQQHIQAAADHEEEFFALMRMGFAAARPRGNPKQMRLHGKFPRG
jgi:hypothetical protein